MGASPVVTERIDGRSGQRSAENTPTWTQKPTCRPASGLGSNGWCAHCILAAESSRSPTHLVKDVFRRRGWTSHCSRGRRSGCRCPRSCRPRPRPRRRLEDQRQGGRQGRRLLFHRRQPAKSRVRNVERGRGIHALHSRSGRLAPERQTCFHAMPARGMPLHIIPARRLA